MQLREFRLLHGDCINREIIVERSQFLPLEERRYVVVESWRGDSPVVRVLSVNDEELEYPFRVLLSPLTEVFGFA